MDCQECKDKLSRFMDNELEAVEALRVRNHLALCPDCALTCSNHASMMDLCKGATTEELLPNESKQMWLRITNVIENEAKPPLLETPPKRFPFLRLAAAMAVIAIISSLVTVFALRRYQTPNDDAFARSGAQPTTFEKLLSTVGLADTPQQARERRLKEQQAAIEYWNSRVQTRRQLWDNRTREAFDRNLRVIDESLNEYSLILSQDPEDELSGEMFDSVLHEKMDLLRDFADL